MSGKGVAAGKDDAYDTDASAMECKAGCIGVADCEGVDDCIGVGKRGCDGNVSIRCEVAGEGTMGQCTLDKD